MKKQKTGYHHNLQEHSEESADLRWFFDFAARARLTRCSSGCETTEKDPITLFGKSAMKHKASMTAVLIVLLIVSALIGYFLLRHPPDPLTLCQKVLDAAFEQWKQVNQTTSYPNIDGDSRKSFAEAGQYIKDWDDYYAKYGYIPGLKADDPRDLVLMYLKEKTRKTWNGDRSGSIRRVPKWMVIGPDFLSNGVNDDFLPEGGCLDDTAEFKRRLSKTLTFLKENNRPHWEAVVKEHGEFLNTIQQ